MASTGRVLRLETARETTERPRARFSCMTESFTSGCLQQLRGGRAAACRRRPGVPAIGRLARGGIRGWNDRPIFSFRHHRHLAVDTVDRARSFVRDGGVGRAGHALWTDGGEPGDGPGMRAWTDATGSAVAERRPHDAPETAHADRATGPQSPPGAGPSLRASRRGSSTGSRGARPARQVVRTGAGVRLASAWWRTASGASAATRDGRRRRHRVLDRRGTRPRDRRPVLTRSRSAPGRPRPRGASRR